MENSESVLIKFSANVEIAQTTPELKGVRLKTVKGERNCYCLDKITILSFH